MCKDDYQLLDMFKNYYTKQGVEHFYIYYNSHTLPNELQQLQQQQQQQQQHTTIIPWDFPYWNKTWNIFIREESTKEPTSSIAWMQESLHMKSQK